MKRCIPPDVKARAEAAEKLLDDALDAMLGQIREWLPGDDEFHRQMVALIDADKRKDG